jgi:hypothetical protein
MLIIAIIFPLTAVIDFLGNELKWFKSNNFFRFLTGLLLGVPLGISIYLLKESVKYLTIVVIWYLLLEIFVAICLKYKNHLDNYIIKYIDSVHKK